MREQCYEVGAPGGRLVHHYGPQVHILADPWTLSLTSALSSPDTAGLRFHQLLRQAYQALIRSAVEQLDTKVVHHPTRMAESHPDRGMFNGRVIDRAQSVVVADVARAGMVPSYIFQQELLSVLPADQVRVDHIFMQRITDADGVVTGVDRSGTKIGGPVEGTTLLLPDPMAATGSSMIDALEVYDAVPGGRPKTTVLCHLMVTPEYLRRITEARPDVHIYALRLDRGMSPPEVLATVPGTRWDEESGLNEHQYIVPGAGGLGELINNAFV